jgi:hypothetical protein
VLGTLAGIALARRSGCWTIVWPLALVLTTPEIVDATGMQLQFVSFGGTSAGPGAAVDRPVDLLAAVVTPS